MTSKSDACDSSKPPSATRPMNGNSGMHHPEDEMDTLKCTAPTEPLRDRFELLSAYLDGEVSAAERRQVDDWLKHDRDVQHLYARLLKLRQGLRSLPTPSSERPVEQTVQQVLTRLDRRPRRTALWGGMAIAALFVGALSNHFPGVQPLATQMVQVPEATNVNTDALMIALDHPVIEIPKAPVSAPAAVSPLSNTTDIR